MSCGGIDNMLLDRMESATGDTLQPQAVKEALQRATAHSPFLRRLAERRDDVIQSLLDRGLAATIADAAAASQDDPDTARALRRERQVVALGVAIADLAGAPFETVTRALSDFADRALDRAITTAIAERTPDPPACGMVALALGKQGSRELNYSSDIDPILLFDPATLPHRPREEPTEAAVRIARRIIELLQEPTRDGYVFRVDLRLRPAAEATPLAVPIDLAIAHYESSALPWERAAFIRARAAAGDLALGHSFLDHIRPFVWRRALDYGAVREVRALSARIRDHHAQGQRLGLGYDLKRGRGGIREVEFFAQIHQLIHGGRLPAVRTPATLDALAALATAGLIEAEDADRLADAYRTLRTIEHRLQMVEDRQTHRLPDGAHDLDNVARLAGLAGGAELIELLIPPTQAAGRLYDGLEQGGGTDALPQAPQTLADHLAALGFADPDAARTRIHGWREGRVRATRSPAAREALEAVMPVLLPVLAAAPAPDLALARFDDLVAQVPSAVNLFRLLEARPALVGQLGDLLSQAPTLADALARQPQLLDGLIDASAFSPPPDVAQLAADLAAGERGEDYQSLLDRVRRQVGDRRFQLGAQLVVGKGDPITVGAGYGRVAEAALEVLAAAAVAAFEAAHGRMPGGELVILALGRLGGGVLTHASDLDLVYLFTGDFLAESDGRRPLGATTYFNRLAQRVTAALSVPTAAGPLYAVDTRLRPSGNQGLVAVSTDSFARYQAESAWTWEHMALTRARPVFGSAAAREAVAAIVADTLRRPRDRGVLAQDALKMRGDIATHKPPSGPFDVKLIEGGLVDAEFAVHVLQLGHGVGLEPRLDHAIPALEEAGLLARGYGEAATLLTRLLVTLRLVTPGSEEPAEASRPLVARACGASGWEEMVGRYDAARALVAAEWRRVAQSA